MKGAFKLTSRKLADKAMAKSKKRQEDLQQYMLYVSNKKWV